MLNINKMEQFSATVSKICNVKKPKQAENSISIIDNYLENTDFKQAERVLIYNPDAIGMWLYQKYNDLFVKVIEHAPICIPVQSVMPSVTPVAFGTMYTGVSPSIHTITKYEKKLITIDSLFDALSRDNKKVALISVQDASMSVIFNERNIDYYIMPYDQEVNEKAKEIINSDLYDVVVVYNQEYDDVMHKTGTESKESINALKNHIKSFDELSIVARNSWKDKNHCLIWATDHGIHDLENGLGTHGSDLEEDLNVLHFYGFYKV